MYRFILENILELMQKNEQALTLSLKEGSFQLSGQSSGDLFWNLKLVVPQLRDADLTKFYAGKIHQIITAYFTSLKRKNENKNCKIKSSSPKAKRTRTRKRNGASNSFFLDSKSLIHRF